MQPNGIFVLYFNIFQCSYNIVVHNIYINFLSIHDKLDKKLLIVNCAITKCVKILI
jgi:hypothetical protein